MARCEVCGNDYDKSFEVRIGGAEARVFDCFECAVHALAPTCSRCGCRILGHGAEQAGALFCGAHCASAAGVTALRDRA
jgi:hypothetical protein